jgi:hypothetical protein
MSKKFPLGAVLSIVGDRLMCEIGMVYKILNFMTDDNLFTHQLPRVAKECRPYLLKAHPFLWEYLDMQDDINKDNWNIKLAECEMNWGKELEVEPIPKDDHTKKDALKEAVEMMGKDKVIKINIE